MGYVICTCEKPDPSGGLNGGGEVCLGCSLAIADLPAPDPDWLAKHMAHVAAITLAMDDDAPLLVCKRDECMVPLEASGRMVWWEIDVWGKTPEELVQIRNKHLEDSR